MTKEMIQKETMDERFILDATNSKLMDGTLWNPIPMARELNRTPLVNNLILRRREYTNEMPSGIIKSAYDAGKELSAAQGMVVSIGPDVMNLQPGDEIIFKDFEGRKIKGGDGNTYYIIAEQHVQAIVGELNHTLKSQREIRMEERRQMG